MQTEPKGSAADLPAPLRRRCPQTRPTSCRWRSAAPACSPGTGTARPEPQQPVPATCPPSLPAQRPLACGSACRFVACLLWQASKLVLRGHRRRLCCPQERHRVALEAGGHTAAYAMPVLATGSGHFALARTRYRYGQTPAGRLVSARAGSTMHKERGPAARSTRAGGSTPGFAAPFTAHAGFLVPPQVFGSRGQEDQPFCRAVILTSYVDNKGLLH